MKIKHNFPQLRDKFIQIEQFLQEINEDLKTKLITSNGNGDFATSKQATLDYEVKNVKSIVCEAEERIDKLGHIIEGLDKTVHQTMQSIADIENQLAMQQRIASVQNIRGNYIYVVYLRIRKYKLFLGHLIWRIKDYSKKLEEAKQYDTILHSAMFSNKAFGYALRVSWLDL